MGLNYRNNYFNFSSFYSYVDFQIIFNKYVSFQNENKYLFINGEDSFSKELFISKTEKLQPHSIALDSLNLHTKKGNTPTGKETSTQILSDHRNIKSLLCVE